MVGFVSGGGLGFELLYFGTPTMLNWREGSYGGSDDIQETREAVTFAVLTILRSKRYKELFLKMENIWVRSGWAHTAFIMVRSKQGACSLSDWGGIRNQTFPPKPGSGKRDQVNLAIVFEHSSARDIRTDTRGASGV